MIGQTISHYKILEKLGEGGMGVVYKAQDLKLGRLVAMKFLSRSLSRLSDDERSRFYQEARTASLLEHQNVETVYEIDEYKDETFLVMRYVEGKTLRQAIQDDVLTIGNIVDLATQIAEGLKAAHEKGITHRDIKSENIMVTPEKQVRIMDFGLAKLQGAAQLTKTGSTLGTVAYMSPEQVQASGVDHRGDIWSFGIVLYEMLTRQRPFRADHEAALMYEIVNADPEPVEKLRPDCPPRLAGIVSKMLMKNPSERYQTVGEALTDLRQVRVEIQSGVASKIIVPAWFLRKKRVLLRIATVGVAGGIMLFGVFRWISHQRAVDAVYQDIEAAAAAGRLDDFYLIVQKSELSLEGNRFKHLLPRVAGYVTLESQPVSVHVRAKRVEPLNSFSTRGSIDLGPTPVSKRPLIAGEYLITYASPGMNSIEFLVNVRKTETIVFQRTLVQDHESSRDLTLVEAGTVHDGSQVAAFLIDQHEVTNDEYLKFVTSGGYHNESPWESGIYVRGQRIPWRSAMETFVDQTGIPGPRYWSGGKYPDGKAQHPVVGISWYEANAYARWAGKSLPTWQQWWRAARGSSKSIFPWGDDVQSVEARANFSLKGTTKVASFRLGASPFGCYDMAGNVREWLIHPETGSIRRTVVGGSWKDPEYMFEPLHAELFDPSSSNDAIGFRCVKANIQKIIE